MSLQRWCGGSKLLSLPAVKKLGETPKTENPGRCTLQGNGKGVTSGGVLLPIVTACVLRHLVLLGSTWGGKLGSLTDLWKRGEGRNQHGDPGRRIRGCKPSCGQKKTKDAVARVNLKKKEVQNSKRGKPQRSKRKTQAKRLNTEKGHQKKSNLKKGEKTKAVKIPYTQEERAAKNCRGRRRGSARDCRKGPRRRGKEKIGKN